MNIDSSSLTGFLDNLAQIFGNDCEIVLHDFTNGMDRTVVHIINGHVTGRDEESCLSTLWFDELEKLKLSPSGLNYLSTTPQGHVLKCGSSLLKDETGNIIGAICVNYDITDVLQAQRTLSKIAGNTIQPESHNQTEVLFHNVNEMIEYYLRELEAQYGKPGNRFDKKERYDALTELNRKGITQISKSASRLCDFFGISRGTLYAELGKIRGEEE